MDQTELVRRLQQGDRSAFEPLYATYVDAASRTAYLITESHATAQDVVHDAFIEVLRSISTLRDAHSFRGWFYRIVINKAKRQVRPRSIEFIPLGPERLDEADSNSTAPDEALLASEELTLLLEAIQRLPEMYRTPVILRYYTELSDVDIAEIMGVPSGTVKSRLNFARKILRQELQSQERGYHHRNPNVAERKGRDGHG